jgi:hypothetical protein
MKPLAFVLALLSMPVAFGQAQSSPSFKPKQSATSNVDPVVTQAMAEKYFARMDQAIRKNLGLGGKRSPRPMTTKPIQKSQVVAEFAAWRQLISTKLVSTPRPVPFDAKRLNSTDPRLAGLVKGGYVARIGPVATLKGNTLTASQFGDAIGYFLARVSEVTYVPSSKWTPIMQPLEND